MQQAGPAKAGCRRGPRGGAAGPQLFFRPARRSRPGGAKTVWFPVASLDSSLAPAGELLSPATGGFLTPWLVEAEVRLTGM